MSWRGYLLVGGDDDDDQGVADESDDDDEAEDDGHHDRQKALHGVQVAVVGRDVAHAGHYRPVVVAQRQFGVLRQVAQTVATQVCGTAVAPLAVHHSFDDVHISPPSMSTRINIPQWST